jgi:hypothetical protein
MSAPSTAITRSLLRAHQGHGKIVEHALLNAEARKPEVGAAPQVAADLKHLGDIARRHAIHLAKRAQAVHIGAEHGDAGARAEPNLPADGDRVGDRLARQSVALVVQLERAIGLAVAHEPLVGSKPNVLVVEGDGTDPLAGQAVIHGQLGRSLAAGLEANHTIVGGDPQDVLVHHQFVDGRARREDRPAVEGLEDELVVLGDPDAVDGIDRYLRGASPRGVA